ncbi:hypothetical protein [Faecalibaculum rodentium]|uniref:hypothetical protein n=1 Tax=Faecalibaculum rodentium TaxID=1702221 RepID=UPI00271532FF|nr:hypothetical protein [Faecalibaculum rodentium]
MEAAEYDKSVEERIQIYGKPYVKVSEIEKITGLCGGTVRKLLRGSVGRGAVIRKLPDVATEYYYMPDIIKEFRLEGHLTALLKTRKAAVGRRG